ncbi:MAG: neutral zinc metallopeptidase [Actinophytocola sp.]|uniref:neutral zinc metallopeptidase n=1 Tax=Actinophytocola sp. TaxID=1872138 RepID=UPI003C750797
MTQPPQGPWRPTGPLPPPQARPLPPRPGWYGPPPGQHLQRPPTRPYAVPPGMPPGPPQVPPHGMPPGPPPGMPPGRYPPQRPTAQFPPPGMYPPPRPANPPWLQYPGHQHLLQPRKKSNTAALVGTLIVVVLFAAVALVGVISMNGKGDSVADTGYDDTATTTTTSSEDYSSTTYDRPTTTTTTTTTTDEETTYDTPTETTQAGPRPVYALEDNPLFAGDVGTPAVTCNLTRWETSPAGAAAFFQSALPCLDAAWRPVMEYQGLPFFTPGIAFPEGTEWSSPCGDVSAGAGAVAAFYCSYDNTLYMPFAGLQTDMYGARPGVYLAVFAHEYGHHVQAMSGVMETYGDARYNTGADTEPGLELSRRFELQAQCFSGMFLAAAYGRGSVDDNILTEARTSQDRGDHTAGLPRDHGSDQHAIAWWEQGAQLNRTYQCNTWLSPPADVS